jgi:hypothetical protein
MKNLKKHFLLTMGGIAIMLFLVVSFTVCDNGTTPVPGTVATPMANPPGGTELESGATVTLSTATAGAEIWYTTNGSAPARNGAGSARYTAPLSITAAVTIKAIAAKDGMTNSGVLTASYTIRSVNAVETPTADPPDGTELESGATVTLSTTTAGAEIWYTTDGSAPAKNGAGSIKYTAPVAITADITIKAIAVKDGMTDSGMLAASYTIVDPNTVARPIARPAAGAVATGTEITLSTTTADAEIWYTVNNSAPAKNGTGSTEYAFPIPITAAVTIKAIAVKDTMDDSGIMEASYTVVPAMTVIAAGFTSGSREVACYWKNGVKTDLITGGSGNSNATAVVVDGVDVYISGFYNNGGNQTACYWKNGVKTDLPMPSGCNTSEAFAIAVQGGTVYTTGYYRNVDGSVKTTPCYWVNGSTTTLDSQNLIGIAQAITIDGGDIHVTGIIAPGGDYKTCYWKNGGTHELLINGMNNDEAEGKAIAVQNGKVYIAGYYVDKSAGYDRVPCYWEDGAMTALPLPSSSGNTSANAIALQGGGIYTAGYYYNGDKTIACYWENNVRADLNVPAGIGAYSNAIALQGSNVYIAGYYQDNNYNSHPCFWKDGARTDLPASGEVLGIAALAE